jgi:hypothetical protein
MSATRDQIGFPSIGIQSIGPRRERRDVLPSGSPIKIAAPTTLAPSPIKITASAQHGQISGQSRLARLDVRYWQFARAVISTTGGCDYHR